MHSLGHHGARTGGKQSIGHNTHRHGRGDAMDHRLLGTHSTKNARDALHVNIAAMTVPLC